MAALILDVVDPFTGKIMGWVVIDSSVNGRSHGGLRVSQSVTKEELMVLARRMTLKFGFLGIASGGSKAGIVGNPEAPTEVRHHLLRQFAVSIRELVKTHRYLPHADMGTSEIEIREIFGIPALRTEPSRDESGFYTSTSVTVAASVAVGKAGKRLDQTTAAIEGFGKVGTGVAKLLAGAGAKIIAISTSAGALYNPIGLSVQKLLSAVQKEGSHFVNNYKEADQISKQDLLALNVDLLCPCAHSGTIHRDNAYRVQAQMICPGANAPITPEAEAALISKGVRVLPDFLTNSGGVLGGTMAFAGIPKSKIGKLMTEFLEPRFTTLFEMKASEVEQHCMDRFEQVKIASESGGMKQKLFSVGLNMYRSGLVPGFIAGRLATRYFRTR